MTTKLLWVALLVTIVVGVFLMVRQTAPAAGSVSTGCNGSTTCFTNMYLSDSLQVGKDGTSLAQFTGTSLFNNALFGVAANGASSAVTVSTAATTSFSLTPAQYCFLTSILVPVGNTTSVTVVFPNQAATAAICSGTIPAGAWAYAWLDNESSFPVTLATTTGSNLTFYHATGTAAAFITYPPKVQATTTAQLISFGNSSTADSVLIQQFQRPAGY
jgi:hypothetical protein